MRDVLIQYGIEIAGLLLLGVITTYGVPLLKKIGLAREAERIGDLMALAVRGAFNITPGLQPGAPVPLERLPELAGNVTKVLQANAPDTTAKIKDTIVDKTLNRVMLEDGPQHAIDRAVSAAGAAVADVAGGPR